MKNIKVHLKVELDSWLVERLIKLGIINDKKP